MNLEDRISPMARPEWGDAPRECVLSLKLVGKKLGIKFGFFFLTGGSLPEVVCTWAGGPPVSAVYEAVQADVQTDLPVLLRRHAIEGDLRELEAGDGEVACCWALNMEAASDWAANELLASPLQGSISGIKGSGEQPLPPPPEAEPEREEVSETKVDLVRAFTNALHYLLEGDSHARGENPLVEQVYKVLSDEMMEMICVRAAHALHQAHRHEFGKLRVGMAVVPTAIEGLPDDLQKVLWEGKASPVLLISWAGGPEFSEVEKTCRTQVDGGGVPTLLYRYGKGEPQDVDPLSLLRSGKSSGTHKAFWGAMN